MLEAQLNRDYYLEKAVEYPLLEQVLAGETTFKGRLDEIFDKMGYESSFILMRHDSLEEFQEYLELLEDLSAEDLDKDSQGQRARVMLRYRSSQMKSIASFATIGLLLIFPPSVFGALLFWGAIGVGTWYAGSTSEAVKLRERREEFFAPVYQTAETIEAQIGRCFVMEDFHNVPKRFGRTYPALTPQEQEAVHAQLYTRLHAGALDMSEPELSEYLGSLLDQEERE